MGIRGNAATRKKKLFITSSVAKMRPIDFEYQSPKARDKAMRETGSPLQPRKRAKAQTRRAAGILSGMTTHGRRGFKTTFTGKRIRWS